MVLQQAQHHSPHQQEPICRPGCASRKHNYHQTCLAALGSCSGGCWTLITVAAAFPDGPGSKGRWLSALGLPSARLGPLQLDPAVLGMLGSAHLATTEHRALPHIKAWPGPAEQQEPFVPAPGGSTGPSSLRVSQGQPCSAQDRAQGAATGINTTLRISLLLAQGR